MTVSRIDRQYENLLAEVVYAGVHKEDRTGTGTSSVFGRSLRYDLSNGFPLITTKEVHWRSVAIELLWFLRGETNVVWLQEQGVRIWNEWADAYGELGPVYGSQWRSWPTKDGGEIDQISQVIESLKRNPDSRRHIVSAWNVEYIDQMNLPPCHMLFQFYVADGKLSCMLTQRSSDMFLGVPFNIASYSLLTHMVAQQVGLEVGDFIWSSGDTHVYDNHRTQVQSQIGRVPKPFPKLILPEVAPASIFDYTFEDFTLENYQHHPKISGKVAV